MYISQERIDEIKGGAWSYVMGHPIGNSIYHTLDTYERAIWEDGILEAEEVMGLPKAPSYGEITSHLNGLL